MLVYAYLPKIVYAVTLCSRMEKCYSYPISRQTGGTSATRLAWRASRALSEYQSPSSSILPRLEPASGHVYPGNGRIAIGTLNICFTQDKLPQLSSSQQLVVNRLASMLETQLRATWEGDRRKRDARAREELSNYCEEAMIGNVTRESGLDIDELRSSEPVSSTASRGQRIIKDLVPSLAGKVHKIITEADTVNVFDIRAVSLDLTKAIGVSLICRSSRVFRPTLNTLTPVPIRSNLSQGHP